MRPVLVLAVWAFANQAALAQTAPGVSSGEGLATHCGMVATAPAIPDGRTAGAAQMRAADAAYRAWAADANAKLRCRADEITRADQQVQAALTAWTANRDAAAAAAAAYEQALTAFNQRSAQARAAATGDR
jgi:hypothetical protein